MRLLIFVFIVLSSCTNQLLTNKEISAIGSMYAECLSKNAWDTLFERHSVDNIKDSLLLDALKEIEKQPFKTHVLYLESDPVELIAISTDKYMVRYVYNPKLSYKALNGYDLSESNKNRILNRVQTLLIEFQCEEGKKQSLKKIKSRNL